ncbi:MAG: ATP synthase gamma chain [Myxococcales bacterium]
MANLKDIRRRITSVKNTRQITRAMKMVAAAKLRRSQERILEARPYAYRLRDMIWEISQRADHADHPLLAVRAPKKVLLLVLTSDRGLAGAFNSNINKRTELYLRENVEVHEEMRLSIIGRKGRDYFKRRSWPVDRLYMDVLTDPTLEKAAAIGRDLIVDFQDKGLDAVYMVYNEFKNAITQKVTVEQLLPVVPEDAGSPRAEAAGGADFIYEPDKRAILDASLPLHINVQIYRAILESIASEMGARMSAMDAATRNAGELISKLTLEYNRVRQAAITKEMLEIVGGAEALKG